MTESEELAELKQKFNKLRKEYPSLCSDEFIISDLDYEKALSKNYELGIESGIERAAIIILDKAVTAFTSNKDETSRLLRSLSIDLENTVKKMAKKRVEHQSIEYV